MYSPALALNPDARWHLLKIGREQTRVLLIDKVFTDLGAVQELAKAQPFEAENATYYPGVRAPCPDVLRNALLGMSAGVIHQAYGIAPQRKMTDQGSWLSLASTPENELHPLQCMPHFDSQHSTDFAIMLYASDRIFQGTGFYRHKPTGFENITPERWPTFEQSRKAFAQAQGTVNQGYFGQSNAEYELMGKIDYRPNRMLVYPGTLLHSGLIDADTDLSTQPQTGRLTVNVFAGFDN